ncbi:MAG: histidine phosphatase family protein [Lachnospiraceae bacterium]|nr:histidine phosphatase family protein [Lachnospiraceae bacterium]
MHIRCILIRHSLTAGNEQKRYTGCGTDESLSPAGIGRINAERDKMSPLLSDVETVFTSPMQRTKETAKLLFPEKTYHVIDDLTEIGFGRFEGKTYEELQDDMQYREWIGSGGTVTVSGVESRESFCDRSFRGFLAALSRSGGKPFCIVCHGGNIMAIMSRLTGRDYYTFQVQPLNGYILDLETEDERILDMSYVRITDGDPFGSSHR